MSAASIASSYTPSYAPAPLLQPTSSLLPDTNAPQADAPQAMGAEAPYADKQSTDLEMHRQFPDLWRAAQAQSKQQKDEARKEAAASLADAPKMVQQSRASRDQLEWVDFALPIFDPRTHGRLARATDNAQQGWPPAHCDDRYFSDYKTVMESMAPLSYQLVGGDDPDTTCISQLPEFIICSDDLLESTFYDPFNWPRQILDYRNISALWDDYGVKGSCALFWKIDCPEPATTPEEINRQIDETLEKDAGTRTYLNQTELKAYLDWREANGTARNFKYILVRDRPGQTAPAPGDGGATPSGNPSNGNGSSEGVLGIFVAIMTGFTVLAAGGAILLRQRFCQTAAPTITTTAPSGLTATATATAAVATATLPGASPSSMASASTTVSHTGAAPQPSPSTTASVTLNAAHSRSSDSDSDDASGIGASAVMLDVPPAGQEDDA